MTPQELGARIRARREELNLSLWRVEKLSGVSRGYLHEIENGTATRPRRAPRPAKLEAIAHALQTTPAALRGEPEEALAVAV